MAFLLTLFSPYRAFQMFCNLVLTKKFVFKSFLLKPKHIWRTNTMMEQIFARFYPETYATLKESRLEIWNVLWIEWLHSMFLKSMHLKASLIFWDFFLIKHETWLFRMSLVTFGLVNEHFKSLSLKNFTEDFKRLIFCQQDAILERSLNESKFALEFAYIDTLIGNGNVCSGSR